MWNISINIFTAPSDLNEDLDMLGSYTWMQHGHNGGAHAYKLEHAQF